MLVVYSVDTPQLHKKNTEFLAFLNSATETKIQLVHLPREKGGQMQSQYKTPVPLLFHNHQGISDFVPSQVARNASLINYFRLPLLVGTKKEKKFRSISVAWPLLNKL